MARPPLLIGEVARQAGVTRKAIRVYERAGIVLPSDRSAAGYRRYTAETVDLVRFVVQAQRSGFSLREIAGIVALWRDGRQPCRHVA
jgi:DNA-binding transcriptional MerR regulator